jgi:hypothetical protein
VKVQKLVVLFGAPGIVIDRTIEMIPIALAALLSSPPGEDFCQVRSLFVALLANEIDDRFIFFVGP